MPFGTSPIFSDTFTRADGAVGGQGKGWNGSTSDFTITSNRLVSTTSGYGTKFLRSPQPTLNDQRLKCTIRAGASATSLIAVVRGSTTQVGGYICWLSGGGMYLGRLPYGGGAGTIVDIDVEASLGLQSSTDYVMTLTAEGTTISATIASAAAPETIIGTVSGTDATYSSGVMGFLPLITGGQIDNVEIYSNNPGAPTGLIEGDSFVTGVYNNFPTQVTAALSGVVTINANVSNGGDTIGDVSHDPMTTQYASQVAVLRDFNIANQFVIFHGGTNDGYYGADAATTYTRIQAYCALARADGFKIIVFTIADRIYAGGEGFDTFKNAYNTLLRAGWASFADGLADVAADPNIGGDSAAANSAYFGDLVHPTNLGATIYSNETVSAISNILAPEIEVVTPTTLSIALVGVSLEITWTDFAVDTVDILLSIDGGNTFPITIVAGTASDGSYLWTPIAGHVSATAMVKIVDQDSETVGLSEEFVVATTERGGATNTSLWFRLQELAMSDGLELSRP